MAMLWKVKAVEPEAAQDGVPWEPFAVLSDGSVLCKTLVEVEGDKSTVNEGSLVEWTPGMSSGEPDDD